MKEFRFHFTRAWRMGLIVLLALFALLFSSYHLVTRLQQDAFISSNFDYVYFQTISNNIGAERQHLRENLLIPNFLKDITDAHKEKYPVLRMDDALSEASRALLVGDTQRAMEHLHTFYRIYEEEYVPSFVRKTENIQQFVELTGEDLGRMKMLEQVYALGFPYEDMDVSTNGAHLVEGVTRNLIGIPFALLMVVLCTFVLIKDVDSTRKALSRMQPVIHWKRFVYEGLFTLVLWVSVYVVLALVSTVLGTLFGGGAGSFSYPVAMTNGNTVELSTLGGVIISRGLRMLPSALFMIGLTIILREVVKEKRVTAIAITLVSIALTTWAYNINLDLDFTGEFLFPLHLINPFTAPGTALFPKAMRLPWFGILILCAMYFIAAVFIAESASFSRKIQDFQFSTKRINVERKLQKEPSTIVRAFPQFFFSLKKLWKNQLVQAAIIVVIFVMGISYLDVFTTYHELLLSSVQSMRSDAQMFKDNSANTSDTHTYTMNREAEALLAMAELAKEDTQEAVRQYMAWHKRNYGYNPDSGSGESMVTHRIDQLVFYDIEKKSYPVHLSKGLFHLPVTLFDDPRTTADLTRHENLSSRILPDITYTANTMAKNGRIVLAGAILLAVLATGFAEDMDRKRTIDFLHVQPDSSWRLYLGNTIAQGMVVLAAFFLAIGLASGAMALGGATHLPDYPTVHYDQVAENSDHRFKAKDLTLYRQDDTHLNERSSQEVGVSIRPMGEENKNMLLLFAGLLLLVIAMASLLSLFLQNTWGTSLGTMAILGVGTLLFTCIGGGKLWFIPFAYGNAPAIATGETAVLLDQAQFTPEHGILILFAYTAFFVITGLFAYKAKFRR